MRKRVYYTTKYTALLLSGMIAFLSVPVQSHALTKAEQEEFKKNVIAASALLQKAIDKSKEKAVANLKEGITGDDLNYQLTMMSFDNQKDPYVSCDYNELIFAYATAKEYSDSMDTLYNLPFYTVEYEKTTIEQYLPKLIQTYEETEDGYYVLGEKEYIDQPTKLPIMMKIPGATTKYEKTGERLVTPENKEIIYGKVSVKGITGDDILAYFGLKDNQKAQNDYHKKLVQADSIVSGVGLSQTFNIKVPSIIELSEEVKAYFEELFTNEELSFTRRYTISVAKALIGKVPYEWGGKSSKAGYDSSWWTLQTNGKQKGLDCSGFVQWVFRTAGLSCWNSISSTQQILKNTTTITKDALIPGDLGLLNNGNAINHVGIYIGDGYWIHCSSGKGTVVAEKTEMFTIFKRMPSEDEIPTIEENTEDAEIATGETEGTIPLYIDELLEKIEGYTEEEIYLLAQLIYNEAHSEGLNGWIGVAEVVYNRIRSDQFPSTLTDVIYQSGQFSDSDRIAMNTPTEEEILVARNVLAGQLQILGNSNVLFFRNAKGSKEDWGSYKWYMEINHHEFYLGNTT